MRGYILQRNLAVKNNGKYISLIFTLNYENCDTVRYKNINYNNKHKFEFSVSSEHIT